MTITQSMANGLSVNKCEYNKTLWGPHCNIIAEYCVTPFCAVGGKTVIYLLFCTHSSNVSPLKNNAILHTPVISQFHVMM